MAHHNTVFAQMLKFIPTCLSRQGHEFESLANQHHSGRRLRKMTRWAQFVAMATAQLSGRQSLRDVVSNMTAQARKLYHLGMSVVSRSSLSRVNASQPYELYEALFAKLPACCLPEQTGRQARPLSSQGAEAQFQVQKQALLTCLQQAGWMPQRLTCVSRCFPGPDSVPPGAPSSFMSGWITRVYYRPACCLPEQTGRQAFVAMTEGKTDDLSAARALGLPKGSIVVMDRGYNDYAWYNSLDNNGIFFVTRLKANARYRVIERRTVLKNKGLTCDQTIQLTGARAKHCPIRLRPACSRQAYRLPRRRYGHPLHLPNQ